QMLGGVDAGQCNRNIAVWRQVLALVQGAGINQSPLLSELQSARVADAHVVLMTGTLRPHVETRFMFNQIPNQNRIAFLQLLGVTLLPATAATCTMQFTKTDDYLNVAVLIPAGTNIVTSDQQVAVATVADLTIAAGQTSGTAGAASTTLGDIGTIAANTIGVLMSSIPGILTASNITTLTGGTNAETVQQGEIRARDQMDIGQHLGATEDYVNYILSNVLGNAGRVTPFEDYLANFVMNGPGYLLLVVQGSDGLAPPTATLQAVQSVIAARHVAGIQVVAGQANYRQLQITASVVIAPGQNATILVNKAISNLQTLYNPLTFSYGPNAGQRYIALDDIIEAIVSAGPLGISVQRVQGQYQVDINLDGTDYNNQDVPLGIGDLPQLAATPTLNVVGS
ncbi:MAG TPA: baseplate J/gp47 family protein, partial [Blastocatellia bacterium]